MSADALIRVRINIVGLSDLHVANQNACSCEHQQPQEEEVPLQSFHNWMALAPSAGLHTASLVRDGD